MATRINLIVNNPKLRRLRLIQADKLYWQEQRQYLADSWAVVTPDFVFAAKYLWHVAVTLTVLYVWWF